MRRMFSKFTGFLSYWSTQQTQEPQLAEQLARTKELVFVVCSLSSVYFLMVLALPWKYSGHEKFRPFTPGAVGDLRCVFPLELN